MSDRLVRLSLASFGWMLLSLPAMGVAQEADRQVSMPDHERRPVRLIFDTDMGNDVDDALALAMIHALADRQECELLAVTLTKDAPHAAVFVDLVNTFYGRGDVPLGTVRDGKTRGASFARTVAEMTGREGGPLYPRSLGSGADAPEATDLLRRVLAGQPDGSVVAVQVGFSTNFARLLGTPGDKHSPLSGRELVAKKVRLLSLMGGYFGPEKEPSEGSPEYNIETDLPAARKLFAEWPTPIVASGWEVGKAILYPAESIARDFRWTARHPVVDAYRLYKKFPYDRPTWDLTSVLHAVRPERGYFGLSERGTVTVDAKGETTFMPSRQGRHRYLTLTADQALRAREAMTLLASQPPARTP
jgi:inosine-uridine nucleoside N-ribohydrolase